jgi:hypothetical protein
MGSAELTLNMILWLCSFGSLIYMLVRLAQDKGALHAVIGFFFPIYPFAWGWSSARRLGTADIMGFWTAIVLIQVGFGLAMGAALAQSMRPPFP